MAQEDIVNFYVMKSLKRRTTLLFFGLACLIYIQKLNSQTKALIIGISQYQDPELKELKHAHRDAENFAAYLKEHPSIKLKEENLQLLTNSLATSSQTILALDRMFESVKKTDSIYLFFSAYAVVDHKSNSAPQQIYFYDTPIYNTDAGSFDLYNLFIELAKSSHVHYSIIMNVIPVYLNYKQDELGLETSENTEDHIRPKNYLISNTIPRQFVQSDYLSAGNSKLSLSDLLLQGLNGKADKNKNGSVNWKEIGNFLQEYSNSHAYNNSMLTFEVSKPKSFQNTVNTQSLKSISGFGEHAYRYAFIQSQDDILAHSIRLSLPDSLQLLVKDFITSITLNRLMPPQEGNASDRCNILLNRPEFSEMHNEIKRRMAAALLDDVQQVLNAYLNAENQELINRTKGSQKYKIYPDYLERASQLLGSRHYFTSQINAKKYYFEGLQLRLLAQQNKDTSLFHKALEKQLMALDIENEASYIHNEAGVDYILLHEFEKAKTSFLTAISYSSTWSVPYMNLALMFSKIDLEKALNISRQAVRLSPKSSLAQHILGLIYFNMKNLMPAEESFLKSLEINSNNPDAYYNLACIKSLTGKKDKAFEYLELAFKNGFTDFEHIKNDTDLEAIRAQPEWLSLLEKYFGKN